MSRDATPEDVIAGRARWCVVEGDSLRGLIALPTASIDVVITDPPYSSGGFTRGDRNKSTDAKYTQTESQGKRPDFAGDTRDQQSFMSWFAVWTSECRRVCTARGRLLAFTDWRQVACTVVGLQVGGWIYRGLVPWDKGPGTRPVPGGFRAQAEFVAWASSGPLDAAVPGVTVLPGVYTHPVRADDKHHQTGKPTPLMRDLARIAPEGGIVLDPFGGSGTTGVGALLEGRRAIVYEMTPEYAEIARVRCEEAARA